MLLPLSMDEAIPKSKSVLASAKQRAKNESQRLKIKLQEAILLAQESQINQSKNLLVSIEQSRFQGMAKLASINLSLLNKQTIVPDFSGTKLNPQNEVIDGINLNLLPKINFDELLELSTDPFNPKTLKIKRFKQSILLVFNNSNQSIALHFTTKPNAISLKKGTSFQQINKSYSNQNLKVLTYDNGGAFMHYPNSRIVFLLDQSNRLMEWAIYAFY